MDKIVIVGGGISGLSLAYAILQHEPSADVTVLEADSRAGGKIWSDKVNGFLCESGVNGFLNNKPKTLELSSALSISPLRSSDLARKRYVFSDSKLHILPESPLSFFMSNLLSLPGRLRIMYEILAPKGGGADESLADFARRRLGREAFEKLIDPMASGIYAGNPETLSLQSCFPRIHELEEKYGSLIRAMIKLQREAKKLGRAKVGAGPSGVLTSFSDGMGTLVDSLKAFLKDRIRLESMVTAIDKRDAVYAIHLNDGSVIETDVLVVASPAHAAAKMLREFDRDLSLTLGEIPYPPLSVVCLGYRKERIACNLDGFGFLVPYREGRRILGTLFDSSIFPNRAPEGHVLIRSMVGGARAGELAMKEEAQLVNLVISELGDIINIKAEPDFVRVYRHERAIPQYVLGHQARLEIIEGIMSKHKGLYLTGNAYRGVSVNDCIENSYKMSEKIIKNNN